MKYSQKHGSWAVYETIINIVPATVTILSYSYLFFNFFTSVTWANSFIPSSIDAHYASYLKTPSPSPHLISPYTSPSLRNSIHARFCFCFCLPAVCIITRVMSNIICTVLYVFLLYFLTLTVIQFNPFYFLFFSFPTA
ncbi:hypothetical protein B9Z19DRAFT_1092702 [Tuber borchii]|uniref:Uncharacterized protein n=1 Tax=Tuber borchii TaxID=42251 RepID=A0A2T6ZGC6_TUBBO|nr:hypothetical protein B9Z19DRAFT_1092702 [Tuber borchii]